MMESCSVLPQGAGFISSVTGYVDCQAQALGSGAWQALSAPGSTLMVVLTGFLTIFIALIGYNLLLGTTMTVRSATLAFVKIGAVFALATSWPAYRTLVYDLVVNGPAQLVSEIGPRAGVVGSDGTLLQRLDLVDHGLVQLAILGPGNVPAGQYDQVAPPPFGGFDAFALGGSRIVFLLTAIAGLTAVRLVAGLMLALGPFFIAFLMFDATRGLFEGWVRVLAGAALASVGASLVLGLELALFEPWLSGVLARRMSGEPLPTVSTELFVLSLLFAILVLAALFGCARAARAFRLPALLRLEHQASSGATLRAGAGKGARGEAVARPAEAEGTRAAAMANMMATMSRREAALAFNSSGAAPGERAVSMRTSGGESGRTAMPLGRSFSRRSAARVSARAMKRDSGA
jgi:type IV secretion system protein VirB6